MGSKVICPRCGLEIFDDFDRGRVEHATCPDCLESFVVPALYDPRVKRKKFWSRMDRKMARKDLPPMPNVGLGMFFAGLVCIFLIMFCARFFVDYQWSHFRDHAHLKWVFPWYWVVASCVLKLIGGVLVVLAFGLLLASPYFYLGDLRAAKLMDFLNNAPLWLKALVVVAALVLSLGLFSGLYYVSDLIAVRH